MIDQFIGWIGRIGNWAYLIVFLGAAAESAAFLGLVVPGESLVLIAGFLSGRGLFDLDHLILTVALGAAGGDSIGYQLGRRLGRPWALHHGGRLGITETRLRHAEGFFSRHGGKAVFLGRFVGFARALVPFIAGSARMRYPAFLFYNLLGASLWSVIVVLSGYFLGRVAERWLGRVSAVLGGLVLLAAVLALLWRWMVRHEAQIKERWLRAGRRPWVRALLHRVSPALAWLRRRLSPGRYFGLQLTLGVLVFVAAAWAFGGIAQDVVAGDPLTRFDRWLAVWFQSHQTPRVSTFLVFVNEMNDWPAITVATLLFLAYLAWRGHGRWLVTVACTLPGGMLLNSLLQWALHRPRVVFSDFYALLHSYSFPGGNVMATTLFYGVIALYLAEQLGAWRWRILLVQVAVFLVALVSLSRVYLGLRYLSDVLAGAAAGLAWLALCYTAVKTLWLSRGRVLRS